MAGRRPVGAGLAAVALAAMVTILLSPAGARGAEAAAETGTAGGAAAAEGAVQTLAGPGYCPGPATPLAGSRGVRALAVDNDGQVFYETGPGDDRSFIAIVAQSRAGTLVSGIPPPPVPSGAPPATQQTPAGAGRMVTNNQGDGVVLAVGTRVIHLDQGSRVTVAGNPTGELRPVGPERSGDHGPATEAQLRSASSLAQDAAGNLYIADHGGPALAHATIRFVNRTDEPVTFYAGTPEELTVEPGHIATVAGAPNPDEDGQVDTGQSPGEAALFGNTTLAVEGNRLYLAHAITKNDPEAVVDVVNLGGDELTAHGHTVPAGGMQTVAGGGDSPEETIEAAAGIAVAGEDLYGADPARHRVRHLDAEGFMATFAGAEGLGATVGGFNGNRRPAVGARLDQPFDVAVGPNGNEVYVADRGNGQVRVVDDSGHIRGLPGAGIGLTWQCHAGENGGQPPQPRPGGPASVTAAEDGTAYFALADAHLIKRRSPDGRLTTVAGDASEGCQPGCAGFAGDGGPADQAALDTPTAVALGPKGGLYVYDGGNARVRYLNLTDSSVTVHGVTVPPGAIDTVAGTGTPGDGGDTGPAQQANLADVASPGFSDAGELAGGGYGHQVGPLNIAALAVDDAGNLFIAETRQHSDSGAYKPDPADDAEPLDAQVRQVDSQGQLTTVAGAGAPEPASQCCRAPNGLALDDDGNLYIADAATHQVWLLNPTDKPLQAHGQTIDAGATEVIAGSGSSEDRAGFAGKHNDATKVSLVSPAGLAYHDDTLYVTDFNPRAGYLHSIQPDGSIQTLTGRGDSGFNGDGLLPRLTSLNLPTDVTIDGCGNPLVADAGNDRLRRLNLTAPCNPVAAQSEQPATTSGLSTISLGLLALAIAAAGAGAGWYWRRHRHRPNVRTKQP